MKTKKNLSLLALLFCFFCTACIFVDEDFVMKADDYSGKEVKLNGYYYNERGPAAFPMYDVYCFYENGVVYNTTFNASSLESVEGIIKNKQYPDNKANWGIFAIEDTIVKVEFIRNYGGLKGLSHTWLGLFPNDSIISFSTELITNQDPDSYWEYNITSEYRVEYTFRECAYKPDNSSFHP